MARTPAGGERVILDFGVSAESVIARPQTVSWPAVQAYCRTAAFYLAWASAVSIPLSIAVSQIPLGMGTVALLAPGEKLRFPPIRLPLGTAKSSRCF
jgi:hypothetical protein